LRFEKSCLCRLSDDVTLFAVYSMGVLMRWMSLFLGQPRSRYRPMASLDGLRGIAVLIVIASHLANAKLLAWPNLSGIGKSGVYLFFVLSAYLLSRGLLAPAGDTLREPRFWMDYLLRRVLRIWPLYLAVVVLSFVLTTLGAQGWHYQLDAAALWRHLTLREGQDVLWSIPVEFTFYIVLPPLILLLAALPRGRKGVLAGAALLMGLMWLSSALWAPGGMQGNDVRLGFYMPVFLFGVLAAWLERNCDLSGRAVLWGLLAMAGGLLWLLTIPSVWAGLSGAVFNQGLNHGWFMFFGGLWAGLLLAVLHGPEWLRSLFSWAPLRFVGVISFSAYLWHMPVLKVVATLGGHSWGWAAAPLVLLGTVVVSAVSFLVLERPLREVRIWRPGGSASG
jgi:peptidoglycan/LPS O-acetylase OafA/YrhL